MILEVKVVLTWGESNWTGAWGVGGLQQAAVRNKCSLITRYIQIVKYVKLFIGYSSIKLQKSNQAFL